MPHVGVVGNFAHFADVGFRVDAFGVRRAFERGASWHHSEVGEVVGAARLDAPCPGRGNRFILERNEDLDAVCAAGRPTDGSLPILLGGRSRSGSVGCVRDHVGVAVIADVYPPLLSEDLPEILVAYRPRAGGVFEQGTGGEALSPPRSCWESSATGASGETASTRRSR